MLDKLSLCNADPTKLLGQDSFWPVSCHTDLTAQLFTSHTVYTEQQEKKTNPGFTPPVRPGTPGTLEWQSIKQIIAILDHNFYVMISSQ
jgi:hypothetical protein